MERLVLGSGSPRRRELLSLLNIEFDIELPNIDERVLPNELPAALVSRLAREKASALSEKFPNRWVLAADTCVALPSDGEEKSFAILGKPENGAEAEEMLGRLSGKEHLVLTGFVLTQRQTKADYSRVVTSKVRFAKITSAEIKRYVATGEPLDKAGAYAIQGGAAPFVETISGSFTNIVGLPLAEVKEVLQQTKLL